MQFKNSIMFRHGSLKRGDRCLYRSWPATYMGSYLEHEQWVHMLKIDTIVSSAGMVVVEDQIMQTTERGDIVCHQQEMKPPSNQLKLV